MSRLDDGDYEAWQLQQQMDRLPDPSVNPCEHCERELERRLDVLRMFARAWLATPSLWMAEDFFLGVLNPPVLEDETGRPASLGEQENK